MTGRTVAHYQVTARLGAGGTGEVYRARDTRLDRDVAIEVLPEGWGRDPEHRARFEREVRVLASIDHPNIAAIYGLEESDGIRFLVLELVEGDTLAERLRHGALSIKEALEIGRQTAEALEAVHEEGIIHRDLKPANIRITPSGTVKVLDFGLAKAIIRNVPTPVEDVGGMATLDLDWSHGLPMTTTREGVVLGTPAYMSPEQARGGPVDRRSDIWSFGCLLFECLTGTRVFAGGTASDSIGAVLHDEPAWDRLPVRLPSNVKTLLRRCLEKDARRRWQHIGDVRMELAETLEPPRFAPPPVSDGRSSGSPGVRTPWIVAAIAVTVAALSLWKLMESFGTSPAPSTPGAPARIFRVALPPEQQWMPSTQSWQSSAVVVAPDGKSLVYTAIEGGRRRLFRRSLDDPSTASMPGTEGACCPMYSPDGEWIAFFAGEALKKRSLRGGQVVTVVDLEPLPVGGCWSGDGYIYFTSGTVRGSLVRVPAGGGATAPETLTHPEEDPGETTHLHPHVLPGGDVVLFSVVDHGWNRDEARVGVLDLATREVTTLEGIRGGNPHYAPTGHLIVSMAEELLAAPFDPESRTLKGAAYSVQDGISTVPASQFSISSSGTLVYLPARATHLVVVRDWFDKVRGLDRG